MIDLKSILEIAVKGGASDIHLKSGLPAMFRINGSLVPLRNSPRIASDELERVGLSIASEKLGRHFVENSDVDFAHAVPEIGRFRVNMFRQRGQMGMVLRVIPPEVKAIGELELPSILEAIALEHRGLVLVTGATGSGKSTTLAAMINHINSTSTKHIVTIEDPIEFLFRDKRSIISQREVGSDTRSFANALRAALRQDPDCILLGEMRDIETIELAFTAAETGHLVLSTLHTVDAAESVQRILGAFSLDQQREVRMKLATNLRAVLSQRLVRRADGRGRVAAMEVMTATARIREIILESRPPSELRDAISQGSKQYGMQTFDQSLMLHLNHGRITKDEALSHCTSKDDFLLRLSGVEATSDSTWEGFEGGG